MVPLQTLDQDKASGRMAGVSADDLERPGDEGALRPHLSTANVIILSLPDHRHCFVAGQRSPGRSQTAEAKPRSNQPFVPVMVLFHDVVQVFALPQSRETPELADSLHVSHRTRVGRVFVYRDCARVNGVRLGQRLTEEPLCRTRIPPGGEQEVDRLAQAVDRAIQIGSDTLDLDVGLIHPPRVRAGSQMTPNPRLQFGGTGLHPTEQGAVIDLDTTIRQHQGKIAIADREGQIPPQRPQDHLGREMLPLELTATS